jgi:hypothetical protein
MYFTEDNDSVEPTEEFPWDKVILVELVRSATGTCVLDVLVKSWFGMRIVTCDFHDEAWSLWTNVLRYLAAKCKFRFEVADDLAAVCDNKDLGELRKTHEGDLQAQLLAAQADLQCGFDMVRSLSSRGRRTDLASLKANLNPISPPTPKRCSRNDLRAGTDDASTCYEEQDRSISVTSVSSTVVH